MDICTLEITRMEDQGPWESPVTELHGVYNTPADAFDAALALDADADARTIYESLGRITLRRWRITPDAAPIQVGALLTAEVGIEINIGMILDASLAAQPKPHTADWHGYAYHRRAAYAQACDAFIAAINDAIATFSI